MRAVRVDDTVTDKSDAHRTAYAFRPDLLSGREGEGMKRVFRSHDRTLMGRHIDVSIVHPETGAAEVGPAADFIRAESPELPSCFQFHRREVFVGGEIDPVPDDEWHRRSVHPFCSDLPLDLATGRINRVQ